MRRYLATLHKRSDSHKKHFALGVSGGVTLSIFAVWMMVNFGGEPSVTTQQASAHEASPLESLGESLSSSWEALKESFSNLTNGLSDVDIKSGYEDLKQDTFDKYVQ